VSGEFAGKIVAVTGAGSGIGRSSAELFARLGAKVRLRVIGVNLLGSAYVIQAFVTRMLGQGGKSSIVNTASMAGLVAAHRWRPTARRSSAWWG